MRASGTCRGGRGEAGFSLAELLVVIVILGVIGLALSQAVIVGFRTTDATAARSSRSVGAQAAASYFTDDVHSAETVATTDSTCAAGPVLVQLRWSVAGGSRAVSYGLDPASGDEQDLVRWSCAGGGPPTSRVLGRFSRNASAGAAQLVSVTCDSGVACPASPSAAPSTVTLTIDADQPLSLTVRRRLAAP